MKRLIDRTIAVAIYVAIYTACAIALASLIYGTVQRDREIVDLKERNAALSRLCGPDPAHESLPVEVQPCYWNCWFGRRS